MKRLIPVALLGSLFVVGCSHGKKPEAAANPNPPAELTQPTPAPAPSPIYTPAPEPAPAPAPSVSSTPAPRSTPAAKPTAAKPAAPAAKPAVATSSKTYKVKKGDTLSEIAKAHNTTMKKIMALNPKIKSPDKIEVGQTIKLP